MFKKKNIKTSEEWEEESEEWEEEAWEEEGWEEELDLDTYEEVLKWLELYWKKNPNAIAYPNWEKKLLKAAEDSDVEEDAILLVLQDLFDTKMEIPHAYSQTFVSEEEKTLEERIRIDDKIYQLQIQTQVDQRTQAWQEVRHNLITASNAYKAFGSEAAQNSLIYEKCLPIPIPGMDNGDFAIKVNMEDARHKGQKYEPISCQIYEWIYATKIGEFGCLQHPQYPFLGASPDGINIDATNKRFGRMLEIKNVQVITQNPKVEYWTQMQMQMEVADLEEADFLETKFIEISEETYHEIHINETQIQVQREWERGEDADISVCKGMIGTYLVFLEQGWPKYVYCPLQCRDIAFWRHQQLRNHSHEWEFHCQGYWQLMDVGCVLVPRNHKWFQQNLPQLTTIWHIITEERETGAYTARAPKKRATKPTVCLIKLDTPASPDTKSEEK